MEDCISRKPISMETENPMPTHLHVIHEDQSNHSVHHLGLVHGFTGDTWFTWFTWFGWSHVFLVFPALIVLVVMVCMVKVLPGFAR